LIVYDFKLKEKKIPIEEPSNKKIESLTKHKTQISLAVYVQATSYTLFFDSTSLLALKSKHCYSGIIATNIPQSSMLYTSIGPCSYSKICACDILIATNFVMHVPDYNIAVNKLFTKY
jgi:hypothetical protein